jgi:hypothetical protein
MAAQFLLPWFERRISRLESERDTYKAALQTTGELLLDGHAVVPLEPTDATIAAIGEVLDEWDSCDWEQFAIAAYKAMIAAHQQEEGQ